MGYLANYCKKWGRKEIFFQGQLCLPLLYFTHSSTHLEGKGGFLRSKIGRKILQGEKGKGEDEKKGAYSRPMVASRVDMQWQRLWSQDLGKNNQFWSNFG